MNARQLEVFRAIMRCGTLTGAARALNVSQPALSQILLHTEDTLGLKLFRRVKGRLVPTPEAEQLFPETERVFHAFDNLRRFAADLRHGEGGLVRLAASVPPSLSLVPRALKAFRAACPGARIRAYVVPVATIAQMLERGDADLAVAMSDEPMPQVETERIGRSEIVCVVRWDHRLAGQDVVTIDDLTGETVISYRGDSLPGRLLARAFADEGAALSPDIEIDVSIIALSFVLESIGIALVDGLLPWASFPGVAVRRFRPTISHPAIALPLCLLTSTSRPLSRHQETLRQHLRDAVRSHAADPKSQGVLTAV